MNAAPLAALAQATGLALLLGHGAAHAQHVHAPVAAEADIAVPASASGPAAAACVCPPAGDGMRMHTPPSPPTAAGGADGAAMAHAGMDHTAMDHAAHGDHAMPDHAAMHRPAAASPVAAPSSATCACTGAPASALPREPIPPLTDADRAAAFPTLRAHTMLHGPSRIGYLLIDRLEGWNADHGSGQAWEASAWYGGDTDRLWLRSEGERNGGRTEAADLEALYGHAVSPWWDLLVGVRQDVAPGAARTSAAFGVQGMAPYKFEVAATLYVGAGGKASARLQGEYDVLLTNRWILQPRLEAEVAFADDRARGIGSGPSTLEAGLRLRYEISRRVAPYLGVVHERAFGATADYRRDAGDPARDTRLVAGVRVWF